MVARWQEARCRWRYDDSRFRSDTAYGEDPVFGSQAFDGTSEPAHFADPADTGYSADPAPESLVYPASGVANELIHETESNDRLTVHLLWEGVLLLFTAALIYLLRGSSPAALRGTNLKELLVSCAVVGLLAVGVGFSLRAAVPNLALGPVAYGSAVFFADRSAGGLTTAALVTSVVGVGVGVFLAVLVVGFQVPAWAASLGVGLALTVWLQRQPEVTLVTGAYQPTQHAGYWFGGFAALAVVGGAIGLIGPIRRTIGAFRPTADPAVRRGAAAATGAVLALLGSTVLASVAGVLLALDSRTLHPASADAGVALAALALGAALLGGTSAFGRRGGVFGTTLAVILLVVLWRYAEVQRWNLSSLAIGAASIIAGLVVTRLIETFGRSLPTLADEPRADPPGWPAAPPQPGAAGDAWPPAGGTGGWTAQLPARTAAEPWSPEDRWGVR